MFSMNYFIHLLYGKLNMEVISITAEKLMKTSNAIIILIFICFNGKVEFLRRENQKLTKITNTRFSMNLILLDRIHNK